MQHSRRVLQPFRLSRRELIEDFAGSRYGDGTGINGRRLAIYVNLTQIAVEAYKVSLAYNDPRFLITSRRSEHASFASRFQTALNNYQKRIHLGDTIREILDDAVFQVGIAKLYLRDTPAVHMQTDLRMEAGYPYADRVSFDNWGHDVTKGDFRRAHFMFDGYDMELSRAMECPYFNKSRRQRLKPKKYSDRSDRDELTMALGSSSDHEDGEIEEVCSLVDVYLPLDRVVATFEVRDGFELVDEPLVTVDWYGPETGPYRFLSFLDVPDNIMPTSPAQSLMELSVLFNYLFRKIARRARQERIIGTYTPAAGEDMDRVMHAEDGEYIRVNRKEEIGAIHFPGPDPQLTNLLNIMYGMFKEAGGNIDAMVGLAPTAGTATQSALIQQQVGAKLAESRRRVNRFVSELGEDLGSMLFDDPAQVIPGERTVPGTDITVDASWLPPDQLLRQGAFADYEIEVEPYSMEFRSPQDRLNGIYETLQQIGPFLPLAQQQGFEFQFSALLDDVAELRDEPRIKRYFRRMPAPMQFPDQASVPSPSTPHEYVRRNVSERSNGGMLAELMTQQPQAAEPMMMAG